MQESVRTRIGIWRRRIGAGSAAAGTLLFGVSFFIYERYVTYPSGWDSPERIQHARVLGLSWAVSFYGAPILILLSLFGLGWSRWIGLIVNVFGFLCSLATLGAVCGPFGC
jgi:hypothetical protein